MPTTNLIFSPQTLQLPLAPGTKIGPNEIQSLPGKAGMDEVCRARDPKRNRDVAIMILPQSIADLLKTEIEVQPIDEAHIALKIHSSAFEANPPPGPPLRAHQLRWRTPRSPILIRSSRNQQNLPDLPIRSNPGPGHQISHRTITLPSPVVATLDDKDPVQILQSEYNAHFHAATRRLFYLQDGGQLIAPVSLTHSPDPTSGGIDRRAADGSRQQALPASPDARIRLNVINRGPNIFTSSASISPDGRCLACPSTESGRSQIFIRGFRFP